jgi:hypothetical protein
MLIDPSMDMGSGVAEFVHLLWVPLIHEAQLFS